MDSVRISNLYYDRIGQEGLGEHRDADDTAMELSFLMDLLEPGVKILDAACGYGRIAIPLAQKGFSVRGLDLSARMVRDANKNLPGDCDISIAQGDMRSLALEDSSFDVVLCLWSSFNSLLSIDDQLSALSEFYRVLSPGGWALIDLADGDGDHWMLAAKGSGPDGHVVPDYFVGGGNTVYLHTQDTMQSLLENSVFDDFDVNRDVFGGRKRLLVTLRR